MRLLLHFCSDADAAVAVLLPEQFEKRVVCSIRFSVLRA